MKFVDFGQNYRNIKTDIDKAIERVLLEGKLILQEDVAEFEVKLAKFTGMDYAVGLNSGTDALFLALKACDIGPGDEVITSSHTFVATVQTIVQTGATPVLVDIDNTGLMNIEETIYKITEKTKAIIPVSITGNAVDLTKLKQITVPNRILIIEDACQALGVSPQGDIACYSFYPAKILGAYGDAGALVTNDPSVYEKVKELRNHFKTTNVQFGYNSRLDNLQAAILNVKLKHLPVYLDYREQIAKLYNKHLLGVGDIWLPYDGENRVWQDYVIRTFRRDELYDYLKSHKIETMKNEYPFPIPKLPNSVKYEAETLRLPCNPEMVLEQVFDVIKLIRDFYGL